MTTPTPDFGEPWTHFKQRQHHMIADRLDGLIVADGITTKPEAIDRIIACVNACQGIPTERLQPGSVKALVRCAAKFWGFQDPGTAENLESALSPFEEPTNG